MFHFNTSSIHQWTRASAPHEGIHSTRRENEVEQRERVKYSGPAEVSLTATELEEFECFPEMYMSEAASEQDRDRTRQPRGFAFVSSATPPITAHLSPMAGRRLTGGISILRGYILVTGSG